MIKLTLCQRVALQTVMDRLQAAQNDYNAVATECGMETGKNYHISPDGTVTEAEDATTQGQQPEGN